MRTDFDRSIASEAGVEPCRGAPCPVVGAALTQRRTASEELVAQYARDLEVIARCEQQIEHDAGCPSFFACMGTLAARSQS